MQQSGTLTATSPADFADTIVGYPFSIRVSARKLSFPQTCPCCTGPSDSTLPLVYTRTTGQRVIHNTSRSWNMPYCRACMAHIAAAQTARDALSAARTVLGLSIAGAVVLFFVFAVAHISVTGILAAAGGIALVTFALRRYHTAALPQAQELWRQAVALKKSSCCDIGVAARYDGWYGSVQTFAFKRNDYARAFASLNVSKVLDG